MRGTIQEKFGHYHMVLEWYEIEEGKKKRKVKWFSTGLKLKGNKRKAEQMLKQKLVEFENELMHGNGQCDKEMYFSEFMKSWLEERKCDKNKPIRANTWESYSKAVTKHIIPYFDQRCMKLKDLKRKDLEAFYTYLLQTLSANTVKKIHVNIRSALKSAVNKELIKVNPANDVTNLPKLMKYHASFYNERQLARLFEVSQGDEMEAVIKLTAYYGFRRSEILGLRWSSIDFEENVIDVNHTAIKMDSGTVYCDKCKNESSFRKLPLSNDVKKYLQTLRRKQKEDRMLYGGEYKENDYVCKWQDGTPFSPDYVSHRFKDILTKYDMPNIRFHDLRHSSASNLLKMGFSLKEIQEWLGHSTITITADTYAHLEFESKVRMADCLDEMMAMIN
jgi:integrase